jgi:hypothetical protein
MRLIKNNNNNLNFKLKIFQIKNKEKNIKKKGIIF